MDARKEGARERLILGLAIAVVRRGYESTSVEDIIDAASVSRRTFYKYFGDKEECFLAAVDAFSTDLREQVIAAVGEEPEWPERFRVGLATLLSALAREPDLARLCIVEPTHAGRQIATRQLEAFGEIISGIVSDRPVRPDGRDVPDDVDAAVLGGLVLTIGARIDAGQASALPGLLPSLLEFALTPYLGSDEAGRLALRSV